MSCVMTKAAEPQSEPAQGTLLFVDDEPFTLSSLKRLFRPLGYRIFTAESGAKGLEVLAAEHVDLVISDMCMPEMDGVQFLEQVRLKSPDTVRILLTGHANLSSTIAAINKGQIYRYIAKPWEDSDITLAVRHALEREKARLEELAQHQNEELKALNADLEEKVKARTEELRQAMGFMEKAHENLKTSFLTSIRIFSNLMELREDPASGPSRRVDCQQNKQLNAEDALNFIREGLSKHYDPQVADAFIERMGGASLKSCQESGIANRPINAKPSMVLTCNFVSETGSLLLTGDYTFDEKLIDQLRTFEGTDGQPLTIFVQVRK